MDFKHAIVVKGYAFLLEEDMLVQHDLDGIDEDIFFKLDDNHWLPRRSRNGERITHLLRPAFSTVDLRKIHQLLVDLSFEKEIL
jgi:hypothetical protein